MSKKSRQRQLEAAATNLPMSAAPDLIGEILAPQEHRQALQISSKVTQELVHWTSPYPPPTILEAYEKIVTGSAQKLVDQAESQTKHRIEMEKTVTRGDGQRSWAGLILAFILCVLCIGGGVACILCGHDSAGATVATGAVVSLAGIFIYGTKMRREERAERVKMMLPQQGAPIAGQPGMVPATALANQPATRS
jgi:uncharacterized membrane protein